MLLVGGMSEPLMVGDHGKSEADFAAHLAHEAEDFFAGTTVEVSGWFVGQYDAGPTSNAGTSLFVDGMDAARWRF